MTRVSAIQMWRRVAGRLVSRLRVDWSNSLMLHAPWSRAAHYMVQGWRIRLSRPPAKGNAPVAPRPTWREFARRGAGILARTKHRANISDWHRWAKNRVTAGSRYIPKGKRKW